MRERHKIAREHKKIACERHKIAREHQKLPVSVTELRGNVCPDTKCRLVPIKLRVVRLPRLRLSAVMVGSIPTTAIWLLQLHVMG